jgi:hypothetical protein
VVAGLPDEGFEQRHLELRGRSEPVDVLVLGAGSGVRSAG